MLKVFFEQKYHPWRDIAICQEKCYLLWSFDRLLAFGFNLTNLVFQNRISGFFQNINRGLVILGVDDQFPDQLLLQFIM